MLAQFDMGIAYIKLNESPIGLLLPQLYSPEHMDSHIMHRLVHAEFKIQVFLTFGYPVRVMLHSPHLKYLENKFYPENPKGKLVSLNGEHFPIFSLSLCAAEKTPVIPLTTRSQYWNRMFFQQCLHFIWFCFNISQ